MFYNEPPNSQTIPMPEDFSRARDWALFLDLDGTLIDIAVEPGHARAPRGLGGTLDGLHRALGGALAVVSGRRIADVDRILRPLRLPAAGQHGAELRRLRGGRVLRPNPPRVMRRIAERVIATAPEGTLVEDKGHSVAVHYRRVPRLARTVRARVARAVAPDRHDAHILNGKMLVEVKANGIDKGMAVDALMALPPFRGRVPIFLGDDRTDEDGFATTLRLGGQAIRVGDGTAGGACLADPQAVRRWLAALLASLEGARR